jgi:mitochondrial fission protein ELM1
LTQPSSWVLSEAYAGLQAQALGLAEAAGLAPAMRVLTPHAPWRFLPAARWPAPLRVVRDAIQPPLPDIVIGCGGVAAAVGAALRRPGLAVVQVQNPRLDPRRFDLIVANRHDELTGPNVVVTRTALHRATPGRLADAAEEWRERMADLPRPLIAVLVGGSNGRFRLDAPVAAGSVRRDGVGVALTPSRRTDPAAVRVLSDMLEPLGGFVWDGEGENPYFGLLALADAIVVTMDSVSMVSEAAATAAPILVAPLPGKSRRIGLFLDGLTQDGRIRPFAGRLEMWPTAPLDDTPVAAAAMRQRLGF